MVTDTPTGSIDVSVPLATTNASTPAPSTSTVTKLLLMVAVTGCPLGTAGVVVIAEAADVLDPAAVPVALRMTDDVDEAADVPALAPVAR